MLFLLLLQAAPPETRTRWLPPDLLYPHPLADPRGPFTGTRAQFPFLDGRHTTLENAFGDEQSLVRLERGEDAFELVGEGGVFARFDVQESLDMDAADFRVGFPLVWRRGAWAFKIHPWHVTSHLGDEIIEREGLARIDYARNEIAFGAAWKPSTSWRVYAEAGWGISIGDPNEPPRAMGGAELVDALLGAAWPDVYAAANVTVWKETDWTPQLNVQSGLWLRGEDAHGGVRVGFEYLRGPSPLTQFYLQHVHTLSFGVWIHF